MDINEFAILLNKKDNVAIARNDFKNIKKGDRFALKDIKEGEELTVKYTFYKMQNYERKNEHTKTQRLYSDAML